MVDFISYLASSVFVVFSMICISKVIKLSNLKISFGVLFFALLKLSKRICRGFVTMQIRFVYEWVIFMYWVGVQWTILKRVCYWHGILTKINRRIDVWKICKWFEIIIMNPKLIQTMLKFSILLIDYAIFKCIVYAMVVRSNLNKNKRICIFRSSTSFSQTCA